MYDELKALQDKFEVIKQKGWIKEIRKSLGSCGNTFESLLAKEENDFPVPDYENIEIKVMNDNAKTNLHLFNLTPDGEYLYPIKRILSELGCPDKDNKNEKRFYQSFNAISYNKLIYGRRAKINVNYEDRKVELIVFDHNNENLNIGVSWSFDYLKERLLLKLKYLAFIRASSCIICGEGYYHYHKISFYELKGFDTFVDLIDRGIIEITFKIGTHKSGRKTGQVYDHGTDFSIKPCDLNLLYNEIQLDSD